MARMLKRVQLERLGEFTAQIIKAKQTGNAVKAPTKDGSKHYTPEIKTIGDIDEKSVQQECKSYLKSIGCVCYVTTTGLLYTQFGGHVSVGTPGLGDISTCLPNGRYAEIECKARNGGNISYSQLKRKALIESKNGIYLIVCSAEELAVKLKPYLTADDFWERH